MTAKELFPSINPSIFTGGQLPYGATSFLQLHNDFKNMIHHLAIDYHQYFGGRISKEELVAIASESLCCCASQWNASAGEHGDTKTGFGLYLWTTIHGSLRQEARKRSKLRAHYIPYTCLPEDMVADIFMRYHDGEKQQHTMEARITVNQMLDSMSLEERDIKIMNMLYGFDGGEAMALREAGDRVGLSHEQVRKRNARMLERMRRRI